MGMRVATFAMSERMLSASLTTQARLANLQIQEASGNVSNDYGGLGTSAQPLLDLEASLKISQSYADAAETAAGRIEVIYSTLSSVTDLLTDFRAQLTSLMSSDSGTTSRAALTSAAEGYMTELASLLNTSYEGRYLFGGNSTLDLPVDLTDYATTIDAESTSYYQGDDATASVKISRDQTVAYGITAGESAFEQAFRALAAIAGAGDSPSDELLQSAYDLVVSSLDETIALQSKVSINAGTLERAQERQADYQTMLEGAISDLRDADVTAIAVQISNYQTQLQASYSAIAKLQSLSLVDYLR
jgi:flagellar hook-associated protein 3 FlgL